MAGVAWTRIGQGHRSRDGRWLLVPDPPALFPEFAWGWRLVDMATASRLTVAKGRDLNALQAVAEETEQEEERRRGRRHPGDRTR